jgi:hypothetical protein
MPLERNTSSAVYWNQSGIDEDDLNEADLLDLDVEEGNDTAARGPTITQEDLERITERSHPSPVASISKLPSQAAQSPSITTIPINNTSASISTAAKQEHSRSGDVVSIEDESHAEAVRDLMQQVEDDEDEEFTFNPDQELQEAQAEQHGYEDAQFYEKVNFGEFSKYMANKRRKLGVQQGAFKKNAKDGETSGLLKGLRIHVSP